MDKKLKDTYKFLLLRLKYYTEEDYKKEIFVFSDDTYKYITKRLNNDNITVEFEKTDDWVYKIRKVEFNNVRKNDNL